MSPAPPLLAAHEEDLPAIRAAGSELLDVLHALHLKGRNVVTELMHPRTTLGEWEHLPCDDVFDPQTGFRYYYHAHPEREAPREHGHFHLFHRARDASGKMAFTHLVGVSVTPAGLPLRAFTTNRWVTDEVMQPADAVGALLDRFAVHAPRRLELVHRWLAAVTRLFRPQVDWLLAQRDQRIAREMPGRRNLFEDRRTALLSDCAISLERQLARLDQTNAQVRGQRNPP